MVNHGGDVKDSDDGGRWLRKCLKNGIVGYDGKYYGFWRIVLKVVMEDSRDDGIVGMEELLKNGKDVGR